MIAEPRISNAELGDLCRRLAVATESGIDVRRIWSREANGRGSFTLRNRMQRVSDAVAAGHSVTDGIQQTGDYFPPLFREMVMVGEHTGKLPEVFRRLADHYEHQVKLKRLFLASIAWPVLQLIAAVTIIGLFILIMGLIPTRPGVERVDVLGFNLMGWSGFLIYWFFVASIVLAGIFVYQAIRRGMVWTRPIQRSLVHVPVIGKLMQTLALSRLAWTMSLTMQTALDLRVVLPLCLRSTHNAKYTDHIDDIVRKVAGGREIHQAFSEAGVFPHDFLDALEVAEHSGRLPESMAHLSESYIDSARRQMSVLTIVGGFAVWALVALLIIIMIFRIAMFYINTIYEYLPQ
jgi:type II secretory pathway component PulF